MTLSNSLSLPTLIGSSSLTEGVVLVISCPATDEATLGDALDRNLGSPSNLKESLVPNSTATSRKTRTTIERREAVIIGVG